jgi:hypothetical protein
MVHVRLPRASNRLAPERNHREVMQRARAFRIFEIHCAIVKNKRKKQDIENTIEHLERCIVRIQLEIDESRSNAEKVEEIDEEDSKFKCLLVNRALLIERITYATEQFGEDQVNIGS